MSSSWIVFSTISPVAKTSPVVSTAVISMTTIMAMIGARLNVGSPKRNGVVTAEKRRFPNFTEVNQSKRCSDSRADDQPKEDGDGAEETTEKPVDAQYQQQGSGRERQVLGTGEIRGCRVATACAQDSDRYQGDADNGDDRAGHYRRKQVQQPAVVGGYQESEDPGDDHGAGDLEQSRQGVGRRSAYGDHRCDRGEGYPLDQWQPDPNPPEADRLDYGSDPARKKVSANELDQLLVREPDSRRQKQRYDHGTRVKCQHVLEPIDRQTLQ